MFLGRKSCVLFFQILLLHKIEGLLLKRGSELTAQSFILVCDLQGTAWTKTLIFTYNGNSAGGCTSPPSPSCGSILGTVTWDNATVNLTLHQNKILDVGTALWDCSHGAEKSFLNTTVIALCMNGKISFEDKIAVSCSCGFPSVEADVEYKDSKDGKLIGKQTFVLGSSSDSRCSSDNRSMDFSSYIENYPSKTKEVCATIQTFSQISTPDKICAGCKYSDAELFLGGFSCFLIVLITSIIMLIILACKMLPEKFGDLSTNKKTIKIIIIVVFILVALIIGLALGFSLEECNQRNLGLGLGLGLGFFWAIVLVVTLHIYHRQCDSKKGNEDENRFSLDSCFRKCQVKPEKEMESPTKISSKKPEDNPERVRSTASASHVKMESKVHSEN